MAEGRKRSSGFIPPELARLGPSALLPRAQPAFDVWSFGVLLFLLCTGSDLFKLDANDDRLDGADEEARLRAWRGVDDGRLRRVFAAEAHRLEDEELEAARDLITWCLQPQPAERPQSMVQVLRCVSRRAACRFSGAGGGPAAASCERTSISTPRGCFRLTSGAPPSALSPSRPPHSALPSTSHRFLKPVGGLLRQACKEVTIPWAEIELSDTSLGHGAGGVVYIGVFRGHTVAVKRVRKGQEEEALAEACITQRLHTPTRHANVLMMWGVTLRSGATCTVTEAMALRGLDTFTWEPSRSRAQLRLADVVDLQLQAAQGLAHVHAMGYAHRDVACFV